MITAHSGSDGYADNSLGFIQAMLDSSIEAFEIDVQLAANGTLYLSHDVDEEAYQGYLVLGDVFQLMKDSQNQTLLINIDCKNLAIGPLAVALAKEYGLLDRIVLSGALRIEDYDPSFRKQLFYNFDNSWDYRQAFDAEVFNEVLSDIYVRGIRVVQFYHGFVTPEIVAMIHRYGIEVAVWTVNELSRIDIYLEMGVYNVTSRSALEYLEARG